MEACRLFSAGAASAPDGEHLVPLMLCGELGEDLILKIGEVILFTEKKRVIGSELVQHQLQVRRITGGKQMLQKGAEVLIAQLPQRMGETTADQLALFAQVDAVILLDELDQSVEVASDMVKSWEIYPR